MYLKMSINVPCKIISCRKDPNCILVHNALHCALVWIFSALESPGNTSEFKWSIPSVLFSSFKWLIPQSLHVHPSPLVSSQWHISLVQGFSVLSVVYKTSRKSILLKSLFSFWGINANTWNNLNQYCPVELSVIREMFCISLITWYPLATCSYWSTWNTPNATEKMSFKFDLILINLNLTTCGWWLHKEQPRSRYLK